MSIRYAGARQAGLTEEKIAALDTPEPEMFTPRERAVIRFAELMATDHLKIDDAFFADRKRHFSNEFSGYGRRVAGRTQGLLRAVHRLVS